MKYSENQIDVLRQKVAEGLSEKRMRHTLGVEKMAAYIGEKIMPDSLSSLRAAALLHDVSKEYSEAEHFLIIKKHNIPISDEEICEPALWHSITAPAVIKDDFSEFASEDILSSAYNHTLGSPDMSIFDEIILLSDYIEEGRQYSACVNLRESFIFELDSAKSYEDAVLALHKAVYISLDNNIKEFISRGKAFHSRTELTRDAFLKKIEGKNNG